MASSTASSLYQGTKPDSGLVAYGTRVPTPRAAPSRALNMPGTSSGARPRRRPRKSSGSGAARGPSSARPTPVPVPSGSPLPLVPAVPPPPMACSSSGSEWRALHCVPTPSCFVRCSYACCTSTKRVASSASLSSCASRSSKARSPPPASARRWRFLSGWWALASSRKAARTSSSAAPCGSPSARYLQPQGRGRDGCWGRLSRAGELSLARSVTAIARRGAAEALSNARVGAMLAGRSAYAASV